MSGTESPNPRPLHNPFGCFSIPKHYLEFFTLSENLMVWKNVKCSP